VLGTRGLVLLKFQRSRLPNPSFRLLPGLVTSNSYQEYVKFTVKRLPVKTAVVVFLFYGKLYMQCVKWYLDARLDTSVG
jgi:hypothetical protein